MNCPACGISEDHQINAEDQKSQCKGCGTIFFNKEKVM